MAISYRGQFPARRSNERAISARRMPISATSVCRGCCSCVRRRRPTRMTAAAGDRRPPLLQTRGPGSLGRHLHLHRNRFYGLMPPSKMALRPVDSRTCHGSPADARAGANAPVEPLPGPDRALLAHRSGFRFARSTTGAHVVKAFPEQNPHNWPTICEKWPSRGQVILKLNFSPARSLLGFGSGAPVVPGSPRVGRSPWRRSTA